MEQIKGPDSLLPNNPTHGKLNLDIELHRFFTFPLCDGRGNTLILHQDLAKQGYFCGINSHNIQCYYCKYAVTDWINRIPRNITQFSNFHFAQCNVLTPTGLVLNNNENIEFEPIKNENNHPYFKFEAYRLNTFVGIDWKAPVNPYDLAKDGFYWIGPDDKCRCKFCGLEVTGWESGDIVRQEHQRYSKLCQFIQGNDVGNVQIGDELLPLNQDITVTAATNPFQKGLRKKLENLGVIIVKEAKHPNFTTKRSRIVSFQNIDEMERKYTPDDLAAVGLIFDGVKIVCYHCEYELNNNLGDDGLLETLWKKHAEFSPNCNHVRLNKDKQFIDQVASNNPLYFMQRQLQINSDFPVALNNIPSESGNRNDPELDARLKCLFCGQRIITTVTNCGHASFCSNCAKQQKTCPICKEEIIAYYHIIIPGQ